MQRINNFLKIYLYFSCLYPITTWTMSNTEIKIRDKYKMGLTCSNTGLNTLQELLIRAKRQGYTDQAKLIQDITTLAQLYHQENNKINDIRSPEYSLAVQYTALQLSALCGFADIFKILLAYDANPHIPWKDVQFDTKSQRLKIYTHNLEELIQEQDNLFPGNSINSKATQSMLEALSTRKWSLLWSFKSPEERAKLLGITLPTQEAIS